MLELAAAASPRQLTRGARQLALAAAVLLGRVPAPELGPLLERSSHGALLSHCLRW